MLDSGQPVQLSGSIGHLKTVSRSF